MCYEKNAQEAKDMEKIIKKLEEARRMYEVVGLEVCCRYDWFVSGP